MIKQPFQGARKAASLSPGYILERQGMCALSIKRIHFSNFGAIQTRKHPLKNLKI